MKRVSTPHRGAIVLRRLESGDVRSVIVSHRTSPFVYELTGWPEKRSAELHDVAEDYLVGLGDLVGDGSLHGAIRRPAPAGTPTA